MNDRCRAAAFSALCALLLGSASGGVAQPTPKPEALIRWRQSAFQVLAWNSGRIKASLDGAYDKEEVIRAANLIAGVASSLGRLFPPGSEQGKGWHDTAAVAAVFSDSKRFGELAASLGREATELGRVAAVSDAAAVKAQYGKVSQSCKACHETFRKEE